MVPDEQPVQNLGTDPSAHSSAGIPPRRRRSLSSTVLLVVAIALVVAVIAGSGLALLYYEHAASGTSQITLPPGNWTVLRSYPVPSASLASGSFSFAIGKGVSNFLVAYWANASSLSLTEFNQTGESTDSTGYSASPAQATAGLLLDGASGEYGAPLIGNWTVSWTETGSDLHLEVFTR